jgi:hypothetical protein
MKKLENKKLKIENYKIKKQKSENTKTKKIDKTKLIAIKSINFELLFSFFYLKNKEF